MITLKTLAEATEQEVFDQVARHLLTQNKKSETNGNCLYCGENGLKCAAGCLIADDEYDPEMEETSWEILTGVGDFSVPKGTGKQS